MIDIERIRAINSQMLLDHPGVNPVILARMAINQYAQEAREAIEKAQESADATWERARNGV